MFTKKVLESDNFTFHSFIDKIVQTQEQMSIAQHKYLHQNIFHLSQRDQTYSKADDVFVFVEVVMPETLLTLLPLLLLLLLLRDF